MIWFGLSAGIVIALATFFYFKDKRSEYGTPVFTLFMTLVFGGMFGFFISIGINLLCSLWVPTVDVDKSYEHIMPFSINSQEFYVGKAHTGDDSGRKAVYYWFEGTPGDYYKVDYDREEVKIIETNGRGYIKYISVNSAWRWLSFVDTERVEIYVPEGK